MEIQTEYDQLCHQNWSQKVQISYTFREKTGEVVVLNLLYIITDRDSIMQKQHACNSGYNDVR